MKMNFLRRLFLFAQFLLSKGDFLMVIIYATLITEGKKTIGDVPLTLRALVNQTLIDLGVGHLAETPE